MGQWFHVMVSLCDVFPVSYRCYTLIIISLSMPYLMNLIEFEISLDFRWYFLAWTIDEIGVEGEKFPIWFGRKEKTNESYSLCTLTSIQNNPIRLYKIFRSILAIKFAFLPCQLSLMMSYIHSYTCFIYPHLSSKE